MSNIHNAYKFEKQTSAQNLTFLFISTGYQDVIKAIQYSYIEQLNGRDVYNLGFGDYDMGNDVIIDNINTNNGDVFKVLNTVLNTILIFFENYPNEILMVQGSDGRPEFVQNCKMTCSKKCNDECKNFNRRINIYRGYVNKNFEQLSVDYQFLGGTEGEQQVIALEPYQRFKKYESVFLFQKNRNFIL